MAVIISSPYIFWLTLGGLLLAAEMLGTGGWLLWCGIAALITGLATWAVPLNLEAQGLCFALLTMLSAFLWWRWLAQRNKAAGGTMLNQRGQSLIGCELVLDDALINRRGYARVGDSRWPVVADEDLPAGCRIIVMAIDGITLRVKSY